MSKAVVMILALALLTGAAFAERGKSKTPLDLMLEGRYKEAQTILNNSKVSPRYRLMYYALTESDVARACSLYQVVAIRYPKSDCDSVARARVDQAQNMGFALAPIAEWQDAPSAARPLEFRVAPPPFAEEAASEESPMAATETAPSEALIEEPVVEEIADVAEPIALIAEPEALPIAEEVVEPPVETPPPVAEEVVPEPTPDPVVSEPAPIEEPEPVALEPETESASTPELEPAVVSAIPPVEATIPAIEEEIPAPDSAEPETAKSPAPPERPSSNGHWYIQVGAFGNFDNAHRLAKELQQAGFPIKLVLRENPNSKLLQVRVGGYPDRAATDSVKVRLKEEFGLPTALVSE